jgi:hypothetical protein
MIWLKSEQKMIEVHQSAAFWIWGLTTSPQWPVLKKSSWKTPESFVRIPLHPKPRVWDVSWHLDFPGLCRNVVPLFLASKKRDIACKLMLVDMAFLWETVGFQKRHIEKVKFKKSWNCVCSSKSNFFVSEFMYLKKCVDC